MTRGAFSALVAAAGCAAAGAGAGVPASAVAFGQSPPAAASAPCPLAFEPAVVDLGGAEQGIAATGRARARNVGQSPVRVARVSSSCACLAARSPEGEIAPGQAVEVEVSLTPGTKPGSTVSKTLAFEVDGQPPSVLTVRATVTPRRMLPAWALPAAGAALGVAAALVLARRRLSPRPSS